MNTSKGALTEQTKITDALNTLFNTWSNPDQKTNSGNVLGEVFFWNTVAALSAKRVEVLKESIEKRFMKARADYGPGDYTVAFSTHFSFNLSVSERRTRLDPAALAESIAKKFKCPKYTAIELIEANRLPGNSAYSLKVVEKV